jgi:1-acyl-sn-glycerol-3-phosphate acyltransferase
MAEMKPQVYKDPRPAEYFDEFHEAARGGSTWVYTLARIVCTLPTILLYRLKAIGRRNVPRRGGVILAPNHFSQMASTCRGRSASWANRSSSGRRS